MTHDPSVPAGITAGALADRLTALLEEPFATCEDVGLDVRRVERTSSDEVELVVELADGANFQLAIARTA